MALLDIEINIDDLPDSQSDLIPPGTYDVTCMKVESKVTKDGAGRYLSCQFKIDGPSSMGRMLFHNLNIVNRNDIAQNISMAQLKVLMKAAGITKLRDSDMLVGVRVKANIDTEPEKGTYPAKSAIKGFTASTAPAVGIAATAVTGPTNW